MENASGWCYTERYVNQRLSGKAVGGVGWLRGCNVGDHERAGTRVWLCCAGTSCRAGCGWAVGEAGAAAYREEGLNDVGLDGAERFVSDDDEDLLLFLQVDEVTEPGFLGEPVPRDEQKDILETILKKTPEQ